MAIPSILLPFLVLTCPGLGPTPGKGGDAPPAAIEVRVPIDPHGEIDLALLVESLAERTGLQVERPKTVKLPTAGVAGALTRTLIAETIGPGASIAVREGALVITIPSDRLDPENLATWSARLRSLSERVSREAERRDRYGFRARKSYRPEDPDRPTVCLVHGLNSNSGSFVHMVPILEEAGFGVVLYDFPDNQDLDITVPEFQRHWSAFRKRNGDREDWAIITHSMGGLIARAYVEGEAFAGDVSDLILIGPPNRGASVARVQTILQFIEGTRAIQEQRAGALAVVGEGLGASAADLEPGSDFLKALNARPRREGVRYRILAGDAGFLTSATRREIESRLGLASGAGGIFGRLARLAVGDFQAALDELSAGTGDGCVAVASTRLEGAPDPVVIHADHVALIRAPLLYPDPGPVACMPFVLRWLEPLRRSGR